MRRERSAERVNQRRPEQPSRQHDALGDGEGELRGKTPQENGIGNDGTQRGDQQNGEGINAVAFLAPVDEAVHVLGDALVGIVRGRSRQRHRVMPVPANPAVDIVLGEPAAPAQNEVRLNDIFGDRRGDIDERQGREAEQKLGPKHAGVHLLQRVVIVAADEGERDGDADYSLIEQHQDDDRDDGDERFGRPEGWKRPDAHFARGVAVEIQIGDPRHLQDDGAARNEIYENRKHRDRQGHCFGQRIVLQGRGPMILDLDEIKDAEHNCFGREDADENLQKARYFGRAPRGVSAEQRSRRQQKSLRVIFMHPRDEREKREKCDRHGQFSHVCLQFHQGRAWRRPSPRSKVARCSLKQLLKRGDRLM